MKREIALGSCLVALLTFPVLFAGGCSESSPGETGGSGGAAGVGGGAGGVAGSGGAAGAGGAAGSGGNSACDSNSDCATTEFCRSPSGCDLPGTCETKPLRCIGGPSVPEACGCNGRTYDSACVAAMAGVTPAFEGTCDCTANFQCPRDEFCKQTEGCALPGTCTEGPLLCRVPPPGSEVCGCNGHTYADQCAADQVGTSVAFAGTCDCVDNADCMEGDYCQNVDACDLPGTCIEKPLICRLPPPGSEACGCDGTIYPSACSAAANGVRVDPDDSCDAP